MFRIAQFSSFVAAFALAVSGAAVAQDTPSADDVVAKYIKATGGKAAYGKLKNRVVKSTLSIEAMQMEMDREEYLEPPNSKAIMTSDFGEIVQGTKGDVAYSVNPMQGAQVFEGAEKAAAMRQASFNPFLNWKDQGAKGEVVGEEEVDGTACWKVEVTREGSDNKETYVFEKESGLLKQIQAMQQGVPSTITFGDYKEVDGVKIAHSMNIGGQMDISIMTSEVKHNVDIPDGTFDLPAEIKALVAADTADTPTE